MTEEIKVKTASDEKSSELDKWPAFAPLFGCNWLELNPFAMMKKFGVGDHAFHMAIAQNGMWAPTVEVEEAGGNFRRLGRTARRQAERHQGPCLGRRGDP